MDKFSIVPLYNYKTKLLAMLGAIITISLWLLSLYQVINVPAGWFEIVLLFLLVISIYSEEKNEVEDIQGIRYTALKISLLIFFAIVIGITFVNLLQVNQIQPRLLFIGYVIATLYISSFYLLYLLRHKRIFEESLRTSIAANPMFYILYTGVVVSMIFYIGYKYLVG